MKNIISELKRFWLVYLYSIAAGLVVISTNHQVLREFFHVKAINEGVLVFLLLVGGLLSASFQLLAEMMKWKKPIVSLGQVFSLPIVYFLYRYLDSMGYSASGTLLMFLFAGSFLLAISSGYWRKTEDDRFGKLILLILEQALITVFLAGMAIVGGMILLGAASALLGIYSWRIQPDLLAAVIFFFGIPYFAYTFPRQELKNLTDVAVKMFRIALFYILIPTSLLLLLVIVSSVVQLVANTNVLRVNSNVGVNFSLATFAMVELCLVALIKAMGQYFLKDERGAYLKAIQKFWKFMLIPVVVVIFVTGVLRTMQYGLTEERYLVFLFGIWGIVVVLHGFIKQIKMGYIALSLGGLLILSTFGPWGMYDTGVNSQIARLKSTLERLGVMENGVVKAGATVTSESQDLREFRSIIAYLWEHKALCRVADLWPQEKQSVLCNYAGYVNSGDLIKSPNGVESTVYYSYYDPSESTQLLGLDGEAILMNASNAFSNVKVTGYERIAVEKRVESIVVSSADNSGIRRDSLDFYYDGGLILSIDLHEYFDSALKKHNYVDKDLTQEDLTFDKTIDTPDKKHLRIKVYFASFNAAGDGKTFKYVSVNPIIFLKYVP